MADRKDILEILALISVAFPNFKMVQSGDVSTADAYLAFLGDLPADVLKLATLKCCSESGRAFAPSVGEIRGAVSEILRHTQRIPSTLEAWDEINNAPKSGEYRRLTDEQNEDGAWIIEVTPFTWSHPLVEKVARMLGFPDFPNPTNEGVDRAHFFKQYENELKGYLEAGVQLPEITRYIESKANEQIKQLTKGMTK